jgi:hypothetical protein
MFLNQNQTQKVCITCGLPFNWRLALDRDWRDLQHCSPRCRTLLADGDRCAEKQERRRA